MSELRSALLLSLQVATLLIALTAIPLAFFFARSRFRGKSLLEALLTVPLVLPPTVVGYFLIVLFGRNGWIGQFTFRWFGYSILFRREGAVLAAAVVSLPLLFLPAKAAFAAIERELEDIARLYGANPLQIFWHVSLPLARRGIVSGLFLAFARALGEFGATTMVLGDREGQRTLPISIYMDYISGNPTAATVAAVLLLTGISLAITYAYNRSPLGGRS